MQNLIIADSSDLMSKHPDCLRLASLHTIAVDFQKSGRPVDSNLIPKRPKMRPDWSAGELIYKLPTEFYPSRRALGELFRNVELPELRLADPGPGVDDILGRFNHFSLNDSPVLDDPISLLIQNELISRIDLSFDGALAQCVLIPQFTAFSGHLTRIAANYSLSKRPLTEEEIWAGTIVARSSQHRRRNDLQARLREQSTIIADHIRGDLADTNDTDEWLIRTWVAWSISCRCAEAFGAKSYGYLALGSMLEALAAIR